MPSRRRSSAVASKVSSSLTRSGCGPALKPRLDRVFDNPDLAAAIGLRPDRVRATWSRFLRGSRRINMQHPFALYVLLSWCSRHRITL